MTAPLFTLIPGTTPLLINVPHGGTYIPPHLRECLTPIAQTLPDTDWQVPLLYEFALPSGAGLMAATHSRYVVDLNRDPRGAALYPAADNTELCPTQTFANEAIHLPGRAPSEGEIAERRASYWEPYHRELQRELEAIRATHGYAVLLDGHSIASQVPRFFEGRLPDLNLGTADGRSCDARIEAAAFDVIRGAGRFSSVLNGRFKGGYITRHYGRPGEHIHALQLEIAQCAYMDEAPPYAWNPQRAAPLIEVLKRLIDGLLKWQPSTVES
jgi:N-formylglutamate amidohydrolase